VNSALGADEIPHLHALPIITLV